MLYRPFIIDTCTHIHAQTHARTITYGEYIDPQDHHDTKSERARAQQAQAKVPVKAKAKAYAHI